MMISKLVACCELMKAETSIALMMVMISHAGDLGQHTKRLENCWRKKTRKLTQIGFAEEIMVMILEAQRLMTTVIESMKKRTMESKI